jgi:A/G-specific adenine glycosylase
MPGMWELPAIPAETGAQKPILKLRHSITGTDYSVFVFTSRKNIPGKWVRLSMVNRLPLTGLTRKILRKLDLAFFFTSKRSEKPLSGD